MRICVFCGASPGNEAHYVDAARAVGEGLAQQGIGVVYGGGRVGLMGASSSPRLVVLLRGALERALAKQGHLVRA